MASPERYIPPVGEGRRAQYFNPTLGGQLGNKDFVFLKQVHIPNLFIARESAEGTIPLVGNMGGVPPHKEKPTWGGRLRNKALAFLRQAHQVKGCWRSGIQVSRAFTDSSVVSNL